MLFWEQENTLHPHPPIMTWEEMEQGQTGQPNLPDMTSVPTVAERAFLILARRWETEYKKQDSPKRLTNHMGDLALACLTLSVEWGESFSKVARTQMEINKKIVQSLSQQSWMNELPWTLCQVTNLKVPEKSSEVKELTSNLDHHKSAIRRWMLEIAWFALPWLDKKEALPQLLKNLANPILWGEESAGLAARFFEDDKSFFYFAKDFIPADEFKKQYHNRLTSLERKGLLDVQSIFWQTEAICRKEIEDTVLKFCLKM